MPRTRRNRRSGRNVIQNVTRNTPDGASFIVPPSIKPVPHQSVWTVDLMAREVQRYSVSVGVSPLQTQMNFSLNQLPQSTVFTNLFDQYRILSVTVLFRVIGTTVYTGNSSGDLPYISTAIDYNDNSSALKPAINYQSCVTTSMITSFSRKFSPRTAIPVYNGVTQAYQQGNIASWIDTQYPSVPHYSLVIDLGSTSIDNQFVYSVDVLYTVQFKTLN